MVRFNFDRYANFVLVMSYITQYMQGFILCTHLKYNSKIFNKYLYAHDKKYNCYFGIAITKITKALNNFPVTWFKVFSKILSYIS